jgi:coenzyme PQQ biosynthesis protein PqqD
VSAAAGRGPIGPGDRPRLAAGARVRPDRVSGRDALLFPEGVFMLNSTGAEIVALCDGRRTVSEVVAELSARHGAPPEAISADVLEYLDRLGGRGLLVWDGPAEAAS